MTEARLSYALSAFNAGRFLPQYNTSLTNVILYSSDITWFVPNSATAYANFQNSNFTTEEALTLATGYHFTLGKVHYSPELTNGTVLMTYSGLPIVIRVADDGTRYVNSAKVLATDYLLQNGVMHIIDE